MTSYDSDSSGDEGEYTETNVLLGYASKEATDDSISHIGGHPQWLDDSKPAPGRLAKCKVCNELLSLLLQLNGDLPERFPVHERRLYIWGCRRKACRRKDGSFRGFRAVRASQVAESKAKAEAPKRREQELASVGPRQDLGSSIFGAKTASSGSTNPFALQAPSGSASQTNPFASASSLAAKPAQRPAVKGDDVASLPQTFADKARIGASTDAQSSSTTRTQPEPSEPWPETAAFPLAYPHQYLDADYESLEPERPSIPSQARVDMDVDGERGGGSGGGAGGDVDMKEAFESSMDRAFQRFADRVAQNPEQVLRYEFGGQPLLYSRDDAVGKLLGGGAGADTMGKVPRCANCGAGRSFELQLMPHVIEVLEEEEAGLDGMDWGTVVFMVCEKDCVPKGVGVGEVGYVEEWVGVQWEEVVAKR